jgi:hypothetical protein
MVVTKVKPIIETQTFIVDVNVADVNVTIISKVTEEWVFKDRKPRKVKSVANWEKEK